MSFSTQKEYFLPYTNELPQSEYISLDKIKLQTYTSSTDQRSWSFKKENQAQYLLDLVACRTYQNGFHSQLISCNNNEGSSFSLVGGDSLLNAATNELTRLEHLLLEKDDLRNQLLASQEKLQILNEEHQSINAILTDRRITEVVRKLEKKVEQLKICNKINKNDENELTKIIDVLAKREQSARVLETQNCYLRRLVAKLSTRCRLETIHCTPEQSTDISYLQSQVDSLRKEVCLLREIEDKQLRTETTSRGIQESCDNNDVQIMNKILAERNALRDKCKNFTAMEAKICQWKREAEEFQAFRIKACNALQMKEHYIHNLECQIGDMEKEGDSLCLSVDCLKEENQTLREEVCRCNDQLQCLRTQICEKECVIEQYDKQLHQVLGVVENLQKRSTVDIVDLQDGHSQTSYEIEKLAASTRLTIDHIQKEIEHRNVVESEIVKSHEKLLEVKENLAKSQENLAVTEENLDLANCEMKLLRKEKELQEALLRANNADCLKSIDELKGKLDEVEQENKRKLEEIEQLNKRRLEELQSDIEKERQTFTNDRKNFEIAKQGFEQQKQLWAEEKRNLMVESGEGDKLREDFEKERQGWINERTNFLREKDNWEKERQVCAKVNDDLNREKAEMDRIKRDFDKARQTFDKERQDMQRERESFASERKQFEQRVANFQEIRQKMEKEKQSLEDKINQLADTLSKKEERRLDSDTEMANLRNQNDDLKKSLTECHNKNDELNKTLKAEQNKTDELNKLLQDSNHKNDILNKQLNDCQNEMHAQKDKISKLVTEIEKLKTDLDLSQQQLKEVGGIVKDISNVKDRNDKLSTVVEAADIECQKLLIEEKRKNAELKNQLAIVNTKINEGKSSGRINADMDCQQILSEERKKNAELKQQLDKANDALRERKNLEKEIEGHRTSNNALRNSISKLTSKINTRSAAEFERDLRLVLDNFTDEICKWRCEKNCKLTKIQEIARKIYEYGLEYLSLKELVYLHQQMCEAAKQLTPVKCSGEKKRKEERCCKCSGEICPAPIITIKNNSILLEKLAKLERDIQDARGNLRKLKEQQAHNELDEEQDLETMRPNTFRLIRGRKDVSVISGAKAPYTIKEDRDDIPTKDRFEI